jgi:hypothetical protein
MKELAEGTCGFVLEAGEPTYDCQICAAKLEQQARPVSDANPADYEFIADSGERIFFCTACFEELCSREDWVPPIARENGLG